MNLTYLLFCFLGVLAVLLALFIITRRSPIAAAILLVSDFVLLAAMYGLLDAHFAAVSQIIVYAGAIMVVFVFVIMLVNIPLSQIKYGRMSLLEWFFILVGTIAAVLTVIAIQRGWLLAGVTATQSPVLTSLPRDNVRDVALALFSRYFWQFELISFVLIAAIVGSVLISKQRKKA